MEPSMNLRQAIRAYKAGNADGFTVLYNESSKYIYSCVYKVMSGNDNAQDKISDIMQDTYVEISKSIFQLEDEERFLSWAGTLATRKCYAYLKKDKKYVLLQEEDKTFENLQESDMFIPETVAQDREKQRLVQEIINTQLTEMQKLCIIAYYYNEQKQSEIAEEFGIPENTVKTNLSRAKAKIKDAVLDLEKNKDTKLYSVAPLLLFLFTEETQAAMVPQEITTKVFSAVGVSETIVSAETAAKSIAVNTANTAASGTAKVGIAAKIAAASVKAKVIAAIAAVGIVGAVGGVGLAASQGEQQEKAPWESTYTEYLLNAKDVNGYILHDIDLDGTPELFLEKKNANVEVYQYEEGEVEWYMNITPQIEEMEHAINYAGYAFKDEELWRMQISVSKNGEFYEYSYQFMENYIEDGVFKSTARLRLGQKLGNSDYLVYEYMKDRQVQYIPAEEYSKLYEDNVRATFQMNFHKITEDNIEKSIEIFKDEGNSNIYQGDPIDVLKSELDAMLKARVTEDTVEEVVTEENLSDEIPNQTEPQGNTTTTIKQILLRPENFGGYYPDNLVEDGILFAVTDINNDGINEVFIGDDMTNFKDVPQRIFNVLYEKDGAVYDLDGDHIYDDNLILGFTVYKNGILKNGDAEIGKIYLWNLYTGESWESNGSDGLCESLCEGEELQLEWHLVTEENIAIYLQGNGIVPPSGMYKSTNGVTLDFINGSVFVSEGGMSTKCTFTVDEAGKLIIVSESETLEGTYDANTDVINLYHMEYKK